MSDDVPPHPHPGATRAVWESFSGALRAWLARRAPRGVDAEELLQETFLRIHAGLQGLTDEERLGPWVWRVARNVLYDASRARGQGELVPNPAELPEPTGADGDASAAQVVASWLEEFLKGLEASDREILRLADLEGLPRKVVAERLGLSLPATKSRVLRARGRLREALLTCCHLEFDRRGAVVDWRRRGDCDCPQ